MSDSTNPLEQVQPSQAQKEVTVNSLLDAVSPAAIYGRHAEACAGLTWGYYGGRWGGNSIANGTLTLAASDTNYVVVLRSTGAVSVSQSTTNWNSTTTYARAYKITTGASTVSAYEDHRAGANGSAFAVPAAPSGTTVGRQGFWVPAGAMRPSLVAGCAPLQSVASGSNMPDITSADFDPTTQEYAQWTMAFPKKWNEGTLAFVPYWSHPVAVTNFGVVWSLQAVAVSNDDTISVSFGTAQTSTDTGGTTNDVYLGPESSAITIAGTPAAEDLICFRISREVANGSDNMAVDARLHGVMVYITTDADTDA